MKTFHKSGPSGFNCPSGYPVLCRIFFRYFSARFFQIKVWKMAAVTLSAFFPPQWFYTAVVPPHGVRHIFPLHLDVITGHNLSLTVFRHPEHRRPVSLSVCRQYAYGQQYCRNYTVSFSSHRFLLFSSCHGFLSMGAAVCATVKHSSGTPLFPLTAFCYAFIMARLLLFSVAV